MSADLQHFLLNDAQRNSLTITLRLLEERILSLKRLLSVRQISGSLFRFENDLLPEQLDQLEKRFDQVIRSIEQLKNKFGLPEKTTTLSSHVQTFTSYFWSVLIDKKAEKLARYGDVAPELESVLNPLIEKILEQLQLIDRS